MSDDSVNKPWQPPHLLEFWVGAVTEGGVSPTFTPQKGTTSTHEVDHYNLFAAVS